MNAIHRSSGTIARVGLPFLKYKYQYSSIIPQIPSKPWISPNLSWTTVKSFAAAAVADGSSAPPTVQSTTAPLQHQRFSLTNDAKVQPFDFTSLSACVAELSSKWLPSRVEEAVQYTHASVALRLRTMEHSLWLYLSWHPTLAHIGISDQGPARGSAATAYSFGEQLHSSLKGLILIGASIPQPWERTVALDFATRPGEAPSIRVYVEIIGRYSNVILTEATGRTVLAAGHQVGTKMSSVRAVYVGKPYALPPPRQGIPPTACHDLESFKAAVLQGSKAANDSSGPSSTSHAAVPAASTQAVTLLSRCARTFHGVSPSLMRELCAAANVVPHADPVSLDDSAWQTLHRCFRDWLGHMETGDFVGSHDGNGGYSLINTYDNKFNSPLEFIRSYYGWFEAAEEFETAKHRIAKAVSHALVRVAKKITSLEKQAADPSVHESTSHQADLIMANLHAIKVGATSITVEDWLTQKPITINLDIDKTPIECAEELYKKARKQRRAVDQVAPLVEEAHQQLEYLQDAECMLQQLEGRDLNDLIALREAEAELVAAGYMKPAADASLAEKAAGKARKAAKKSGKRQKGGATSGSGASEEEGLRRYTSPGGFAVLIGRNSTQNDHLTMRMAQPTDVWMHARGVPGAHVLLRVPPGQDASDEDLQFTADLAAFFSKSRSEGKLDVTVANPAHISKPKGAKPGQVMVKQETVLIGRPAKSVAAAEE